MTTTTSAPTIAAIARAIRKEWVTINPYASEYRGPNAKEYKAALKIMAAK